MKNIQQDKFTCVFVSIYWNTCKKAQLLPLLGYLLFFGISFLMSCGNQFACFHLVCHLSWKGEEVNWLLLVALFFQLGFFVWHTYSLSTVGKHITYSLHVGRSIRSNVFAKIKQFIRYTILYSKKKAKTKKFNPPMYDSKSA